ncbi:interferon-induced transmembrane protein 1-like [Gavia stellata]|uniref:interferon-induced transmembrane protein 1-like n=1 Tax=Gavia stellata TaxID=37040 RepID=UPI0028A11D78|nr:interferon-induced transmembrane protein 1-like [Gavia stellata]
MENFPQSVSINMQPYGRNGVGSPATAFGPTVTSFVQPGPIPSTQDFVLWSFFNAMFCNPFCLGFIALIFSVKARDMKIAQDSTAASSYGRTAKHLNIAALCLGIVGTIICIVLLVMYYRSLQAGSHL